MMQKLGAGRKNQILLLTGIVLFCVASVLAYLTQNGSWFTVLIIFTFYFALYHTPAKSLVLAAAFSLYASLFSLVVLKAEITIELFFVIIVWLFAAYFPSRVKKQSRQYYKSEALHRGILEASPHGIVQTDLDGTITFCNPKQLEIVGAQHKDELLGKNAFDFIVPEQKQRAYRNLKLVLEKGNEHNLLYTAYKLDGSTFEEELSVALTYDEQHKPSGFIGIIRDITKDKRSQRLNEERRHYLEAILDSSISAILTLDTNNNIKEWNLGAIKLFHYTKEEALGRNLDALLSKGHPDVFENAQALTSQVNHGLPVPPTETVRYTKAGEPINVIVSGAPIMVEEEFSGIVATYTDITQLKRAEEKVQSLLEEKEQLLREVHHRIKNHMTTLSSIIMLNSYSTDEPKVKEVLEEVSNRIKIMQNIYQDLYTSEDLKSMYISTFIEQLIGELRSAYIYEDSITILTDIEEVLVTAKQSLPIGIIINELVTNSLKYAFPDMVSGTIRVSIRKIKDNYLRIEVKDDGKGIPEEVIQNKHYGFGLTLVDSYNTQFNGEMNINSYKNNGTQIVVKIKLQEPV